MKMFTQIIKKITLIVILSFLLALPVTASEVSSSVNSNEYDSLYRYNALENKASFNNFSNQVATIVSDIPTTLNTQTNNQPPVLDVGAELEEITVKQTNSITKADSAMDQLANRSELTKFFVGNNLGILRFQLVQLKDESSMLSSLQSTAADYPTKKQINNQISLLKEEQSKVENFILKKENKFSLFGWLVTIL